MADKFNFHVFLSHNGKDKPAVEQIARLLRDEHNIKAWLDKWNLVPGEAWQDAIEDALDDCQTVAVFLGPSGIGPWENEEMRSAIEDRVQDPQRRVIPVLLPGAPDNKDLDLPRFLRRATWVDFRSGLDDKEALYRLNCGIIGKAPGDQGQSINAQDTFDSKHLHEAITTYTRKLEEAMEESNRGQVNGNPYKDFLEYDIRDASLFFGRGADIDKVFRLIKRHSLTVLQADSGTGKTSLLKAGLRPHLYKQGYIPIYINLLDHPKASICLSIKSSIVQQIEQYSSLVNITLRNFLTLLSELKTEKEFVIIIDQFEEAFTAQTKLTRDDFVKELASCLNDDLLRVRWVLSVRAEFFSKLATFQPQIRYPFENTYLLPALSRDNAREAVLKPAHQRGVSYDTELVEQILDDLGSGSDDIYPPKLQLVCAALYERHQGVIGKELYNSLGGVEGIIQERMNLVLQRDIPSDQREIASVLLKALVTSAGMKAARTREELENTLKSEKIPTTYLGAVLRTYPKID
jgi:hypothetical protein